MINRFVFMKLKDEWSSDSGLAAVIEETRRVLPSIPGVKGCEVGQPADAHAGKGWDVGIRLTFSSLADADAYRVHPTHKQYLEDFLEPKVEAKRAWNFSMSDAS
jgi:hypothetical protein